MLTKLNTLDWKGKGRIMSNRDKLQNLINDITRQEECLKDGATEDLKNNRMALLSYLLEMYCTWHDDGDCMPQWVQVGAYNPRFIHLRMSKNFDG